MPRIADISKKIADFSSSILYLLRENGNILRIALVLISFAAPIMVLFYRFPETFEVTWKGRTFYLFFLWLVILELIISWRSFTKQKSSDLLSIRSVGLVIAIITPAIFVLAVSFWELSSTLASLGGTLGVPFALPEVNPEQWKLFILQFDWPLSLEYLILAGSFVAVIWLAYGKKGLTHFLLSISFLGAIGTIYMIDTLYPAGYFSPFQAFVPLTATLAAGVLNWMGYKPEFLNFSSSVPILNVTNQSGAFARFGIGWPCAGIQSLLIYTVVILIFFRKSTICWKHRIVYFLIGAVITYLINILRIATIFLIAINGGDWRLFHDFLGELYAISWIVGYPLIIMGSRILWTKLHMETSTTA